MDGQQWIWVAVVIVGAVIVAAAMVFGRRLQTSAGRELAERDAGDPPDSDGGTGDGPGTRPPAA